MAGLGLIRVPAGSAKLAAMSPHARGSADNSLTSQLTPVFTVQGASSLTTPITIAAAAGGVINASAPWRYTAGDVIGSGANVFVKAPTANGARVSSVAFPLQIEFDFDGQAFEINLVQQFGGGSYRVWANEQVSAYQAIAAAGGAAFVKVDFGSRAQRRITIEADFGLTFGGITHAKVDSIMAPTLTAGATLAVVGDSFSVGQGITAGNVSAQSYAAVLARLLGFVDWRMYGQSGTGLLAPNGSVGTYRTRIADVAGYQPDVLLIQGSINDAASGGANTLGPEIATYVAALRAQCPSSRLVAVSPMALTNSGQATNAANATDCKAGFLAAGVPYVDAVAGGWFFGTGKVGATTGDGNADFYQSSVSASHPSVAGHDYMARRIAAGVAPLLPVGL